jgi:hypothetical protein
MAEITALELVVIEVFDHRFQYRQELLKPKIGLA